MRVVNEIVHAVEPEDIDSEDSSYILNRDGVNVPISFEDFNKVCFEDYKYHCVFMEANHQ